MPRNTTSAVRSVSGTFSHGSLLASDLCDGMIRAVDSVNEALSFLPGADRPNGAIRNAYLRGESLALQLESLSAESDTFDEAVMDIGYAIDEWIAELSGGRFYFGMHPGDGSDLGIWSTKLNS